MLSLPVITICPPEQSNTALNVHLVKAGNITLVDTDRQALKNVSRELLIHEPSQRFVEIVSRAINKEALAQLKAQTRSYPLPKENSNAENSQHFEIWSTEVSGSYKIGSQTNCSEDHPNISLTLYIGQKFNVEKEDLTNETFEVEVVAMGDDEYTIDYIEGEEYVFHGSIGTTKYWADAESHCNDQNGHLVSIHTNYENDLFQQFQRRYNKGGHKVWLGGSDSRIEGVWEWSDGSPFADVSATTCNSVKDVQKYGLQKCANWAKQQPAGGTRRN